MLLPKMAIQIILLVTIFMSFFSAVCALKCYAEATAGNVPLTVEKCTKGEPGCGVAMQCTVEGKSNLAVRGCISPNFCDAKLKDGTKLNDYCDHCSYCSGSDLCNHKGLTDGQKQAAAAGGGGGSGGDETPSASSIIGLPVSMAMLMLLMGACFKMLLTIC